MSLIPKQFINDLLDRIDIVSVIDARVPLKKAGSNYVACCPFHSEKTPSFTVSPSKQFYHCFGCGAHGTAISFVMEFDRLEFPEAVETLADMLGLEVPREGNAVQPAQSHAEVYALLAEAADYFRKQLRQQQHAIDYLKSRGLSGKTAADYGIGYAPAGWDNLLKSLNPNNSQRKHMLTAGLIAEGKQDSHYDRFRDRIMFPIRDSRGRTIGFGGRVLGDDDTPKYLNSPETPVFHKGKALYGVYEMRQRLNKTETLLVVEGYMDAVMLAEHGIHNVVATLGTATTSEHINALFKLAQNIVFCFDGDKAGRQAAWRALETVLPLLDDRHQIRFLFLPEGEDPDSLLNKKGSEAFLKDMESALPLSEYLLKQLETKFDLQSLDGKAQMAEHAKPLIKRIREGVFKDLLSARLASLIGLPADKILSANEQPDTSKPTSANRHAHKQRGQKDSLVRKAIASLLSKPDIATTCDIDKDRLSGLDQPGINLLLEIIELIREQPPISTQAILHHFNNSQYSEALSKLAAYDTPIPDDTQEVHLQIFQGAIQRLQSEAYEQRYNELVQKPPSELSPEERLEIQKFRQS